MRVIAISATTSGAIIFSNRSLYTLNIGGNGKPSATLRESQTVQLETWNMATSPTLLNHFATAEYLAAGYHYFQFTVDTAYLYLYEVSVEAF